MFQVPTVIVGLGALLFLIALLGGGFTVREISLPTISSGHRIALVPISIVMMALGVWLSVGHPAPSEPQPGGLPVSSLPTQGGEAFPTNTTAVQPAAARPTETDTTIVLAYQSSGTLIYMEDFEDGYAVGWDTQWEPQMEIIQLNDGNHVYRTRDCTPVLTLPEDIFDYAIEARIMKSVGAAGAAGLGARWIPSDSPNQMYFAYIDFRDGWLNLVETDGRGEELQATEGLSVHSPVPFAQGTWYTLAIEVRGSLVSVYLNGQLVGSDEDDTLLSNRVALWSWDSDMGLHEFYFDDIRIWSLQ